MNKMETQKTLDELYEISEEIVELLRKKDLCYREVFAVLRLAKGKVKEIKVN